MKKRISIVIVIIFLFLFLISIYGIVGFFFGFIETKTSIMNELYTAQNSAHDFIEISNLSSLVETTKSEVNHKIIITSTSSNENYDLYFTTSALYERPSNKRFEIYINFYDNFDIESDIDLDWLCEFANMFAIKTMDKNSVLDTVYSTNESYAGENYGYSKTSKVFFTDFFETEYFRYDSSAKTIVLGGRANF